MTPRERVLAALSCQPADMVPFDLGGTKTTSMNPRAERNLKAFLGFDGKDIWGNYRFQRMHMPEELSVYFDTDVRRVGEDFPEPLPAELTAPVQVDEFGVTWTQTGNGLFTPSVQNPPLAGVQTAAELEKYPWPDPDTWQPVDTIAGKAKEYHENTDYAVCIDLPDCVVQFSQYLRGTEQWMVDLLTEKAFITAMMEIITDIYIRMVQAVLSKAGAYADVVIIPDDMGGQQGLLMSPETYRELIKPLHAKIFNAVRKYSSAKVLLHSCGDNFSLIKDYIEIGVDALNPVQVSANNMDTKVLHEEFGKDICFWGAVDTQHVLPKGSPDDVRMEVKKRIEDLGPAGYIVAPVHVIQAEVPPENILALAEAAHRYGGRSDGTAFTPGKAAGYFKNQ